MSLLPRRFRANTKGSKLESVSISNFGGGWNAVDDDISMSPKYLVTQKNMHRTASGASELRYGTEWFSDIASVVNGSIVDHWYFANNTICVTTEGEIAAVDNNGTATAIWNAVIAAALIGAPSGWTAGVEQVTFVPFRDTLVIHNGVDKPVSIDTALAVTYLQDLSSGSNANVPIGKYGCTVGNYHVVAGIPAVPTVVYIASKATSGTFPGDAPPNDAISLDVGAYAPAGATEIRGVAGFRQFLIVFFLEQAAIFTLGAYSDAATPVHTPVPFDTLPHFGLLGQRCVVQLDKDIFLADFDGAGTATRNLFSGVVDTDQLSDIVAPEYQGSSGVLTADEALTDAFSVYDRLGNKVLLFLPGGRVFVYSENAKLRYKAWSEYRFSTPFTSACSTFLGRVILAKGTRLYRLGNLAFNEQHRADLAANRDGDWMNSTGYGVNSIIHDPDTDGALVIGTIDDPKFRSPSGLAVNGATNYTILIDVERRAESHANAASAALQGAISTQWDGKVYYSTSGHGESRDYYKSIPEPDVGDDHAVIELDMSDPTAGGADWITSTIDRIRLDFDTGSDGQVVVHSVKIGHYVGSTFVAFYSAQFHPDDLNNWTAENALLKGVTGNVYLCNVSHTSPATSTFENYRDANDGVWTLYEGEDIEFEMELPWISGRDPMQLKQLRFLSVQSKGNAQFTVEVYVDNLYKDVDGAIIYDPALTIDLVGNETGGYGEGDEQPFGGGRRSGDPRLLKYPVKFKSIKFRILGTTKDRSLQVIGINTLFSRGSYKR